MPVTSEEAGWLEITVWQDGRKDFCCKEHVSDKYAQN